VKCIGWCLSFSELKKMHGETLKFVNAQQAKPYNIYKNTKLKLLKTNAGVFLCILTLKSAF